MDPDAALNEIRALVARVLSLEPYADPADAFADLNGVAELVDGLDAWLTNDGALPEAWAR